jgi:hypothetical protein
VDGAVSYNVYGRTGSSFLLLGNVPSGTTFVDTGSATPGVAPPASNTAGSTTVQVVPLGTPYALVQSGQWVSELVYPAPTAAVTSFSLSGIVAPSGATVVATLLKPDGVTTVATQTLTAGTPATVYAGTVALSPVPADSTDPYLFTVVANGTDTITPVSTYGFMQGGVWVTQIFEPTPVQTVAPPVLAETVAAVTAVTV